MTTEELEAFYSWLGLDFLFGTLLVGGALALLLFMSCFGFSWMWFRSMAGWPPGLMLRIHEWLVAITGVFAVICMTVLVLHWGLSIGSYTMTQPFEQQPMWQLVLFGVATFMVVALITGGALLGRKLGRRRKAKR